MNNYNNHENQNNQFYPENSDLPQNGDLGVYNQERMNEYCFMPSQPKNHSPKKSNTALKVVVGLACCAAVSVTSIIGYSIATGGSAGIIDSSSSYPDNSSSQKSDDSSPANVAEETAQVKRTDLPTIYQLSAPEDALAIPEIVTKVSPSVVGISCLLNNGTATGTGIVLSEDGYIVTNAHVVSGAQQISVVLPEDYYDEEGEDGYTYEAELIGADVQTDIAVLKINKTGLKAAEIGKSSETVVGEAAIVIGNPLGFDLAGSVTSGIISAKDRKLTIEDRTMNLIQTDASINSGNSGGPLINSYGQVVGITSAKVSSTYGEGLGFAIPTDDALPIIQDLLEYGYVTGRPTLGISGENISELYAQFYNIPQGFIIRSVEEGSAAQKAGLNVDDVIIGINGELISTVEEFNDIKSNFSAGDKIKVSAYRDGEIVDFEVVLGEARSTSEDSSSAAQQPYDPYQEFYDQFQNFGQGNFGN